MTCVFRKDGSLCLQQWGKQELGLTAIPSLSDVFCPPIPLLRNITYNKRLMSLSSSETTNSATPRNASLASSAATTRPSSSHANFRTDRIAIDGSKTAFDQQRRMGP